MINIKKHLKSKVSGNIAIAAASVVLIYIIVSIYFANHFFFNTSINGANVSLKSHKYAHDIIKGYVKHYKLQLIERNAQVEEIVGQDIGMEYNEENSISAIYNNKTCFKWIISLFKEQKYYVEDMFVYNKDSLQNKINKLNCLNKTITEPRNVSFKYSNGSFEEVKEVYGDKINKEKFKEAVEESLLKGDVKLNLNEKQCYENPKYTLSSSKVPEAKNLLNRCVKANITYVFGNEKEKLDGNTINTWLGVDDNLDVVVSEIEAAKYVKGLSKKYDTVGLSRNFKTSLGKTVLVNGGLYGWKINREDEVKALMENIKLGETIEKEPVYTQKAVARGQNEIGNTYVEVNITRQHIWFYKNGRLLTQGPVVTGDVSKGYSTVTGLFMLNYKQRDAILEGPGYSTLITYWMPFFGNTGIHEASWRSSFGGDIYKNYGSHGCVNTPTYVAKTIYENIEEGTPIICYEE